MNPIWVRGKDTILAGIHWESDVYDVPVCNGTAEAQQARSQTLCPFLGFQLFRIDACDMLKLDYMCQFTRYSDIG
jgi:hypothetical protein